MINLDNAVVKEIVNKLVAQDPEARLLYLQSIKNESGQGTQNSRGTHGWDYRYNTIIEIANKYNLSYVKLNRGKLWEAILLRGLENEIYVFFTQSNLRRILKNGKDNHYLKLLNLFNEELNGMSVLDQQMSLLDQDEKQEDDLKEQAREMLHMMASDPSKVIVMTFNTAFFSTAKALAFNTRHELVWEKDLTELIDVNYQSVLKDDKINPEKRESSNANKTKEQKKRIVKLKG